MFISIAVSLAVADLLVGLAVLPFSSTWEVFKVSIKNSLLMLIQIFYFYLVMYAINFFAHQFMSENI